MHMTSESAAGMLPRRSGGRRGGAGAGRRAGRLLLLLGLAACAAGGASYHGKFLDNGAGITMHQVAIADPNDWGDWTVLRLPGRVQCDNMKRPSDTRKNLLLLRCSDGRTGTLAWTPADYARGIELRGDVAGRPFVVYRNGPAAHG